MSEVPDIIQSAEAEACNSAQATHSRTESPAAVQAREDNLMMDAEDSLPAIHLQSASGDGADEVPATTPSPSHMDTNDDVPFAVQIAMMEQKELQMDNNEVTAQFYSHMLACYLIEQDFTKARLCRKRAAAFDDSQLRAIITITQHLENGETGAALKLMKSAKFTEPIKTLVVEVQSRVCLSMMRQIERCYVAIESSKLAQMFDAASDAELQQMLALCGWKLDEDGFVRPQMTTQLQTLINEKSASPYGPLPNVTVGEHKRRLYAERNPSEDLNRLARIASFIESAV
uniref:CSN8/PSMD8/EIF3K domain-containing protein n=1 Tax=Ascaris lumbricoides TaxID=6252 RepID=A0A9J2P8Y2_ASCLU